MWESFEREAGRLGGQAVQFDQPEWGRRTGVYVAGGICLPLVCLWLACQHRRVDFVADPFRNDFVQTLARMSAEYYSLPGTTWSGDFSDTALEGCGIVLEHAMTVEGDAGFTRELRNHISSLEPGYYYVGFAGRTTDPRSSSGIINHAIGLDTHHCEIFDPEAGKATFNSVSDLCSFAKAWIDGAYQITAPVLIIRRYVDASATAQRPAAPTQLTWT
jgi:hypothetical protein